MKIHLAIKSTECKQTGDKDPLRSGTFISTNSDKNIRSSLDSNSERSDADMDSFMDPFRIAYRSLIRLNWSLLLRDLKIYSTKSLQDFFVGENCT